MKITLSTSQLRQAVRDKYVKTVYGYLPIKEKEIALFLNAVAAKQKAELVFDKQDCYQSEKLIYREGVGFIPPSLIAAGIGPVAKLLTVVVVLGGVAGGVWYVSKKITEGKQEGAQGDLGSKLEAQQANRLLAILHPKSYEKVNITTIWTNPLQILDTAQDYLAVVDKTAVVAAASGIKNFDKVSEYYTELTKKSANLADDIRKVLSAQQQTAFFNTIAISANTSFEDIKDQVVYAAPTNAAKMTTSFRDKYFKTPAFSYPTGTKLGTITELLIVPFIGADKLIHPLKVYKMTGAVGQITGKEVYVLVSQVTTKKP